MTTPLLANAEPDFSQKPSDWEHVYAIKIDGKILEAIKFLGWYVLRTELPSLSAIGAADCALCFQEDVRKQDGGK